MKKETLEDYCKKWTVDEITSNIFTLGIKFGFSTSGYESASLQYDKNILARELKRRMK